MNVDWQKKILVTNYFCKQIYFRYMNLLPSWKFKVLKKFKFLVSIGFFQF